MADDDVFRIMVSTDNHLGVWEKDEVRRDDSFNSFEEVFEIAQKQNVDMVLLGGDLFHDNKPSRNTIVRAIDILTKYCLNDKPVPFQVVSDQRQNFTTGRVNYQNPNYNIGLPVFTIHGNHDDPAGADNLSAVDILSSCNLVNYFGKVGITGDDTGKIKITPVLLKKGETKLAVYGLGNLRDERLCRIFATPNSVSWVRPVETEEDRIQDWFNVFVLHQNRMQHTAAGKNNLREGQLAKFLDFVIWGHEHECLADPWESAEMNNKFSVIQPGSTVATALSEGEAKRKHCVVLEIKGSQYRVIKHALETVRPFAFDTISLGNQPGLEGDGPEAISAFLEKKVTAMIKEAIKSRAPRTPELPIVRLRVDYTGFSTINTQRFGQKFVGKVANPHDVILWQKAIVRKKKDQEAAAAAAMSALGNAAMGRPEALDEARIEDLIATNLKHQLEILPEPELAEALRLFVERGNTNALTDAVKKVLQETQVTVANDQRAAMEDDLADVINDVSLKRKADQANVALRQRAAAANGTAIDDGAGPSNVPAATAATTTTRKKATVAAPGPLIDEMDIDDQPAPAAKKAPAARAPRVPKAAAAAKEPALKSKKVLPNMWSKIDTTNPTPSTAGASQQRKLSSRAAAAKASKKLTAMADDIGNGGNSSGDEDVELKDNDVISDSDESIQQVEEEDELQDVVASLPVTGTKRGRTATQTRGARSAARTGTALPVTEEVEVVDLLDPSDDDEPAPATRRPATGTANKRGTAASQAKSWGKLK